MRVLRQRNSNQNLIHYALLIYKEAKVNKEEFPYFKEVMDKEMQNMEEYKVWEYVENVPRGMNIIGCKWVLTRWIIGKV